MESDINMRIGKLILSFILSLTLVLGLFALQLSLFTHIKLFNSKIYITTFEKLNLYSTITASINNELSTLSRRCNLPKEIFAASFSDKWVKNELDNTTKNLIDFMTYKTDKLYAIDIKSQEAAISANISSFLKASNLKIDDSVEVELIKVKNDAVNMASSNISPINTKSIQNSSSFVKVRKNLNNLYIYKNHIIGFLAVAAILLLLLHIKKISQFGKWLGFSLIAGGLITFIPALIGLISKFTNNLAIGIPSLKALIAAILKEYIAFFSQTGLVIFAAGLLLIIVASRFEKAKK